MNKNLSVAVLFSSLIISILASCNSESNPVLSEITNIFQTDKEITTYTTKNTGSNGLLGSAVSDLVIDGNNNLWLGTKYGLCKYDGKNWQYFETINNHEFYVENLFCDSKNNIWIMNGYNKGLSKYDGNQLQQYRISNFSMNLTVNAIEEDEKGNLWFAHNKAVSVFDGVSWKDLSFTEVGIFIQSIRTIKATSRGVWIASEYGLANYFENSWNVYNKNYINNIVEDKFGNIWFSTSSELMVYDGTNFESYETEGRLQSRWISSSFRDSEGKLIFGTNYGISVYDYSRWYNYNIFNYGVINGQILNSITSIEQDKYNRILFNSRNNMGGYYVFDGISFDHISTKDGLIDNNMDDIAQLNDGSIWFSNFNGANKFDGHNWESIYEFNGEYYTNFFSIANDNENNLWFSNSEGIYKFNGSNFKKLENLEDKYLNVNKFFFEDNNILWLATYGGVVRYDLSSGQYTDDFLGLSGNLTSCVFKDSKGNYWFGLNNGIRVYDGNLWLKYNTHGDNPISSNTILDIIEDNNKNIWVATRDGINSFDGEKWTQFNDNSSQGSNFVNSIMKDKKGTLWFATNAGIKKYDGSNWTKITSSNGLVDDRVNKIFQDMYDNIWVTTNRGICMLLPD